MSHPASGTLRRSVIRRSNFKVHYADGRDEASFDREGVRAGIASGEIGEDDRISIAGGLPKPWWDYRPFADLKEAADRAAREAEKERLAQARQEAARASERAKSELTPAQRRARKEVAELQAADRRAAEARAAREQAERADAETNAETRSASVEAGRAAADRPESTPPEADATGTDAGTDAVRAGAGHVEAEDTEAPPQGTSPVPPNGATKSPAKPPRRAEDDDPGAPDEAASGASPPAGSDRVRSAEGANGETPETPEPAAPADLEEGAKALKKVRPGARKLEERKVARKEAALERIMGFFRRVGDSGSEPTAEEQGAVERVVEEPDDTTDTPLDETDERAAAAQPDAGVEPPPTSPRESDADPADASTPPADEPEEDDVPVFDPIPLDAVPGPFDRELLSHGGMALRAELLQLPLDHILGVSLSAPRPTVIKALHARRTCLEGHRDAGSDLASQRVGIADSIRIVQMAFEVARSPRDVREYHSRSRDKGRPLLFREFVEFEPSLHDPSAAERAKARPTPSGDGPTPAPPEAFAELGIDVSGEHKSDKQRVLDEAAELVRQYEERGIGAAGAGTGRKGKASAASGPGERKLGPRAGRISRSLVAALPNGWDGDARSGDIVYGVGDAPTGVMSVMPIWSVVFVVLVLMIPLTTLDQWEPTYDGRAKMQFVRAGLLVVGACLGLLLRGEGLKRFGFAPVIRPTLVSLIGGVLVGLVAIAAVPFEVRPEAAASAVVGFVVLRAATEALFFEGFVARTLLIEFPRPAGAFALSVALFGLYMNTYRFLWDPAENPPVAGAVRYAVLVGLPSAYAFYRCRSWLPSFWIRTCALLAAAMAAMQAH